MCSSKNNLPTELILYIRDLAIAPPLPQSSVLAGLNKNPYPYNDFIWRSSFWRHRIILAKSLVLVNRLFYEAGIGVIWEYIAPRDSKNWKKILEAAKGSPAGIRRHSLSPSSAGDSTSFSSDDKLSLGHFCKCLDFSWFPLPPDWSRLTPNQQEYKSIFNSSVIAGCSRFNLIFPFLQHFVSPRYLVSGFHLRDDPSNDPLWLVQQWPGLCSLRGLALNGRMIFEMVLKRFKGLEELEIIDGDIEIWSAVAMRDNLTNRLKRLAINGSGLCWDLSILEIMRPLSGLESLKVEVIGAGYWTDFAHILPVCLKELELSRCYGCLLDGKILEVCPGLRKLKLDEVFLSPRLFTKIYELNQRSSSTPADSSAEHCFLALQHLSITVREMDDFEDLTWGSRDEIVRAANIFKVMNVDEDEDEDSDEVAILVRKLWRLSHWHSSR